jgi:hypothetical protein
MVKNLMASHARPRRSVREGADAQAPDRPARPLSEGAAFVGSASRWRALMAAISPLYSEVAAMRPDCQSVRRMVCASSQRQDSPILDAAPSRSTRSRVTNRRARLKTRSRRARASKPPVVVFGLKPRPINLPSSTARPSMRSAASTAARTGDRRQWSKSSPRTIH